MSTRYAWRAAALALITLPAIFVPIEALSFFGANRSNGFLVSSGERREYSLYVPKTYDARRPVPLVISMPGAALWGAAQEAISGWDVLAEREGFIVVYPTGASGGGPRIFHVEPTPDLVKDVRFISDVIDTLQSQYNIDAARIYANGLSNGGGMAFVLSCTLSDRIAAVGMVSAAQTLPWNWCTDSRPVPMIAFHGTADRVVPYGGGHSWVAPEAFPNVPLWAAKWARRNRCTMDPIDATIAANITRRAFGGCAGTADVEFYTIRGGGHDWPGGGGLPAWLCGPISHAIDATSVMWTFFRAHPLARKIGL